MPAKMALWFTFKKGKFCNKPNTAKNSFAVYSLH